MPEPELAAFPVSPDWLGLGLSKRECAAIYFTSALLANPKFVEITEDEVGARRIVTKMAIAIADELLTQLEGTHDETAP